jgi:hypothetical protein
LEAGSLVGRTMRQSFEAPRLVYELAVEHEGEFIRRVGAFFEIEASVKYLATVSLSEKRERD